MEKLNKKKLIDMVDMVYNRRISVYEQTADGFDTAKGHADKDLGIKIFKQFHSMWYKVWIKKYVVKAIKRAKDKNQLITGLKLSILSGEGVYKQSEKATADLFAKWRKGFVEEYLDELENAKD